MLLDIFTKPLSIEELSEFERFGYASSGIGLSILFMRIAYTSLKSKSKSWIVILIATPVVYFISVSTVYELVNKIPDMVPKSKKPVALSSAVSMLSSPSINDAFGFYLNSSDDEKPDISQFIEMYPYSNKQIRYIYIQGIRNIDTFSRLYGTQVHQLNKDVMTQLYMQNNIKNFISNSIKSEDVGSFVVADFQKISTMAVNPLLIPELSRQIYVSPSYHSLRAEQHFELIRRSPDSIINGDLFDIKFAKRVSRSFNTSNAQASILDNIAWQEMRAKMEFLPSNFDANIGALESARLYYSKHLLSKYGVYETLIPWHSNRNIYLDDAYLKTVSAIAPFFFSNERPITDLSKLRNRESRNKYIYMLQERLPNSLKVAWDKYRFSAIERLVSDENSWDNVFENQSNKDLIRVSTALPLLFIMSIVLILANIYSLFKISPIYLIAGGALSIGSAVAYHFKLSHPIIDAILWISVRESQVFLL